MRPSAATPDTGGAAVDPDTPVYVISVAAELVGAHPQTLRSYERAGLVDPARTRGGARRYSTNDIAKLRRIQALTDEGIPLSGVARILELERRLDQLTEPSTALVLRDKGARRHSASAAHSPGNSRQRHAGPGTRASRNLKEYRS